MSAPTMGIGRLGTNEIRFIRKWRWVLSGEFPGGSFPGHFCKIAARPSTKEGENFITTTFFDCSQPHYFEDIYKVIGSFMDQVGLFPDEKVKEKLGKLKLELYLGDGTCLETWDLEGVRPTAINWGDLDFSNSEEVTIEVTWKFEKQTYTCKGPKKVLLPTVPITPPNT